MDNEQASILNHIISVPWLIYGPEFDKLCAIASRDLSDIAAACQIYEERQEKLRADFPGARRLDGSRGVMLNDSGTAVMPVYGPMFRKGNLLQAMSGAMSMELLESDFLIALANPDVKSILLDIDSPGGEAHFTAELANTIQAARGIKPIQAFSTGLMCSAAFWLASATDQVIASNLALVGSVGALGTFTDTKDADKKEGVKTKIIKSDFATQKAPDAFTKEGEAQIQAMVNQVGLVFAQSVADNLNIPLDQVIGWEGGVMVGADAMDAGMTSQTAFRSQVIEEMNRQNTRIVPGKNFSAEFATGNSKPAIMVAKGDRKMEDQENTNDQAAQATEAQAVTEATPVTAAATLAAPVIDASEYARMLARMKASAEENATLYAQSHLGRITAAAVPSLKALYLHCEESGQLPLVKAFVEALPTHGFDKPVNFGANAGHQAVELSDIQADDAELAGAKAAAERVVAQQPKQS